MNAAVALSAQMMTFDAKVKLCFYANINRRGKNGYHFSTMAVEQIIMGACVCVCV